MTRFLPRHPRLIRRSTPLVYSDGHCEWRIDIEAVRTTIKAQSGMTMEQLIERQVNYHSLLP